MKVITLQDPWASLVMWGEKKIETRSWKTNYRGPLLIHASKNPKKINLDLAFREPFWSVLKPHFIENSDLYYPGCIIAKCNLVDCLKIVFRSYFDAHLENRQKVRGNEFHFGDYAPGRFAWILEDIEPLENPIPAKGQLGLWEFDLEGALNHG